MIDKDQLESYAAELESIKTTLETAYANAELQREDAPLFLTCILALEGLAAKIIREAWGAKSISGDSSKN